MLLDPQELEPRVVARRPVKSGPFQVGGECYEAYIWWAMGEPFTFLV